jgi:hypothetical protein
MASTSFSSTPPASGDTSTSSTGTGGSSSSEGSGGETSSGAQSSGEASTTEGTETTQPADLGPLQPPGCKGKVDFLFVISRNGGMDVAQQQLLTSFPGFLAAIQGLGAQFDDFDYHIMVVDTDKHWGSLNCMFEECNPQDCGIEGYPCDQLDTLTACDATMGAGTIFNAGYLAPNVRCAVPEGQRYITQDQPALEETFTCMATVGVSGYPLIGEAIVAAVSPALRAGCNQGFLREDALLVLTFISGVDYASKGTPEEWAKAVFDAKGGDPNAIVMLGVHGGSSDTLPECLESEYGDLCRMLVKFPYHVYQHMSASDWSPAFAEAVGLIDQACTDLIPG